MADLGTTFPPTLTSARSTTENILRVVLIQKMFRAEDIASEENRQRNHVYDLLVTLRNLHIDKPRRQVVNSSMKLTLPTVADNGQSTGYRPIPIPRFFNQSSSQWRREGVEGGRPPPSAPGSTLQWAAFEGRKFGILTFSLQCVSVSLYLFLIYSVQ